MQKVNNNLEQIERQKRQMQHTSKNKQKGKRLNHWKVNLEIEIEQEYGTIMTDKQLNGASKRC